MLCNISSEVLMTITMITIKVMMMGKTIKMILIKIMNYRKR